MSSDNPISAAQSSNSSDSKSVAKSCPVSGQSVAIVPVRYAIDDMDEKGNQLNPFPEKGNWQGPFKLKHAKYTMRRLRDGWLYVYDEDAETFHEYQVQGANLIKYDWGSDESTKEASERGSAGDSKVYLSYPAKHTLFLGFSYHRWTWRVCEHMRSHSGDRKKWMRKLDLNDYCHSDSLYNHHAGYYEGLVDAVADIAAEGQTIDSNMFSNTCTPFSIDQEQQESNDTEADNDSLEVKISPDTEKANKKIQAILDDYPLLKEKNYASICDYALPENTSGLFIALDDKQADICDLMCLLNIAWADKQIVLGDDTVKRKIMIGEIVRSLACVPVPEAFRKKHEQLEPDVVIAAESRLNYLLGKYQNRSYQYDSTASGSMGIVGMQRNQVTSPKLAKEISDFEKDFFKITEDMKEQYRKITEDSKIHKQAYLYKGVIEDFEWSTEVDKNSDGLYDFLQKIYREANKKDPNIKKRFIDLAATTEQLGDDLLILGYDSEKVDNTTYYLSLFSSVLETLSNSVVDDEQKKYLNKIISFDKPRNLLALMPAAGSKEVWNALDDFLLPLKEQIHVLDSNNAGDWQTGFGSGLDITSVFGDEQAMQIKWFSALAVPVKNTITALQALVQSSIGKLIWSGFSSTIFSVQMVKAPLNIARYLMANSIAQKQNLIAVKNYQELDEKFRKELKKVLSDFKNADSNLKAARGEIGDIEKKLGEAKTNYENSLQKKENLKLEYKIDKLNSDLKSLPSNDGPDGVGVSRKTESEAKKINRKIKDFKNQLSQLDAEISSNKLEYERQQALSDKLKQIKANAAQNKNLIKVYEDELKDISDELAKLKATQPLPLQLVDENLNKEYRTALYKKFKAQLGVVKDKAKVVVSDKVMGGVFVAINLWKFVVVGAAYHAKNDENDSFDAADRELTYVGIWTINSTASFLSLPKANFVLNNEYLYSKSFKYAIDNAVEKNLINEAKLLRSFLTLTKVIAITGVIASYLETSETFSLISDNGTSGMAQLGAIIKFIGLIGQLGSFSIQFFSAYSLGSLTIGSAFLGPMAIVIGAAALLYLVGSILINVFELKPIESWVRKSIWGVEPEPEWKNTPWLELRSLEEIYYKPKVELSLIFTKNSSVPESELFGNNGFYQYNEISITLPKYLKNRKVTIEILSSEYGGNKKNNYLLDESNGTLSQNIDTGEFIYKIHCQPARVYSVGIRIPSILTSSQTITYIGNGMILPSNSAMYSAGYRLPGIVGEKINLAKHKETTKFDLKFEEMSEYKMSNILHQVMVKEEG